MGAERAAAEANESFEGLAKKEERIRQVAAGVDRMAALTRLAGATTRDSVISDLKRIEDELIRGADDIRKEIIRLAAEHLKDAVQAEVELDQQRSENASPGEGGKPAHESAKKVERLVADARAKGVAVGHENVAFSNRARVDLLAEALLRNAIAEFHRGAQDYAANGWKADAAWDAAARVETDIQRWQDMGVPPSHPKVTKAIAKAKELREQEGLRKREFNAAKRRREAEEKKKTG